LGSLEFEHVFYMLISLKLKANNTASKLARNVCGT
jgi:hypothetical protein